MNHIMQPVAVDRVNHKDDPAYLGKPTKERQFSSREVVFGKQLELIKF